MGASPHNPTTGSSLDSGQHVQFCLRVLQPYLVPVRGCFRGVGEGNVTAAFEHRRGSASLVSLLLDLSTPSLSAVAVLVALILSPRKPLVKLHFAHPHSSHGSGLCSRMVGSSGRPTMSLCWMLPLLGTERGRLKQLPLQPLQVYTLPGGKWQVVKILRLALVCPD